MLKTDVYLEQEVAVALRQLSEHQGDSSDKHHRSADRSGSRASARNCSRPHLKGIYGIINGSFNVGSYSHREVVRCRALVAICREVDLGLAEAAVIATAEASDRPHTHY